MDVPRFETKGVPLFVKWEYPSCSNGTPFSEAFVRHGPSGVLSFSEAGRLAPVVQRLNGQAEVVVFGKAKVTILVITMLVALIVIIWAIVASVSELSTVWYW